MNADASRLISSEGSLDLRILARRIWRQQLIIWAVALLGVVAAILYLQGATYKYTVTYEVTPVEGASDGLSSTLGKVGGIAQLAGIDLAQGGDSSFKLYLAGVESGDVAEALSHDQQLMHAVFAGEWDPQTKSWREPTSFTRSVQMAADHFINFPGPFWHEPDAARLHEFLMGQIDVKQDSKGATTIISMKSANPAFAIMLLDKLHAATDDLLRKRALIRIDDYLRYLTEKLRTVVLAENRAALAQALGDQERARMLASSPRSFSAEIFQSPAASITPTSPRPMLMLIVGFVAGTIIGSMIVLVRIFLREFALDAEAQAPTG